MIQPIRRSLHLLVLLTLLGGCATQAPVSTPQSTEQKLELERPIPYPLDIPQSYSQALEEGTRTESGEPGDSNWQNQSSYDLKAELDPETHTLHGSAGIRWVNRSPDTLDRLLLEVNQNLHAPGTLRKEWVEVTGGMQFEQIQVNGADVPEIDRQGGAPPRQGYLIDATRMLILLEEPLQPGESVDLSMSWNFRIPEVGAGGRMGRSRNNLYFIAYWYPKVAMYDDVEGWFVDPFLGNAEFYHEFSDYQLEITLPDDWLVMGSGAFLNPDDVLAPHVLERYRKAIESDEVVPVVTDADLGAATQRTESRTLTWRFEAENIRDVAFSATRESVWDAARTPVGDLDGDGETDYTHIHSFYRNTAPHWQEQAAYAQHSISFLSDYLEMPYPWPHMTSVEGEDIIGGGMEFPMITVMGSYNQAGPQQLHGVTAHEFAHMWVPMMVSTNERRYTWMDEGMTTFNTHQAMVDAYPEDYPTMDLFYSYLGIAGTDLEGPMMRWSDYHYPGPAYGIASYPKPASVLQSLKTVLGEETFLDAYHTFLQDWKWQNPYPWDFFNTVERVSGEELDWFWRSWYYETWVLDQAVRDVQNLEGHAIIELEDIGRVPMPVDLEIELEDGTTLQERVPVDLWLDGSARIEWRVETESPVVSVTIDPEELLPDTNIENNRWERP